MDINFKATILIAHGDPHALDLLKEALHARYHVKLAGHGADAARLAALPPHADLILLDSGLAIAGGSDQNSGAFAAIVTALAAASPMTPILALADGADGAAEADAWLAGVADVMVQPASAVALRARVALHLELAALRTAGRLAPALAAEDDAAILAMAALAEPHEAHIGLHLLRTQRLVAALGAELQFHERFRAALTPAKLALIVKAAPLHDIGKVKVDPAVLTKQGRLTAEDMALMRIHTTCGRDAIEAVARTLGGSTPFLRCAADIAWSHQEKWDGSGYPQGLAGDAIPVAARLMAAADVYDALVTARPYRPAFTHETAIELIRQGRGEHFDPDVADAVLVLEERFRAIAAEFAAEFAAGFSAGFSAEFAAGFSAQVADEFAAQSAAAA